MRIELMIMSDKMVEVLRRQFEPVVEMLKQQVAECPDEFWNDASQKYWKHVFHAATSMKFWFRQQKEEAFIIPDFGRDITEALDQECSDYPTKEEMTAYVEEMMKVARSFVDELTDETLMEPCVLFAEITKMDVVLMQIRHVQHHVGYCNSILNSNQLEAVKWI
ncbi:DinB family protein [Paenibacillus sp. MMS20-IR301]|uniref:DinB family protein n=1 Tax=Paenibacillus sp. MMS20-IR301 TaxID=2895946 RepID=UPI0028EEEF68|nr:DinB family protein [Paenibacillus sp. MMS20-IR301]WNS45148.1 DinB family protein [Paenibacillus sp. MMS20-IR301]